MNFCLRILLKDSSPINFWEGCYPWSVYSLLGIFVVTTFLPYSSYQSSSLLLEHHRTVAPPELRPSGLAMSNTFLDVHLFWLMLIMSLVTSTWHFSTFAWYCFFWCFYIHTFPFVIHSTNFCISITNLCMLCKAKSGNKAQLYLKLRRKLKNEQHAQL